MPRANQNAGPNTLLPLMAAPRKEALPRMTQNQPNPFIIPVSF